MPETLFSRTTYQYCKRVTLQSLWLICSCLSYTQRKDSSNNHLHTLSTKIIIVRFWPLKDQTLEESTFCWENYTYTLPRIQRGSIIFQGEGGMSNFFQGVRGPNANFYRNPYTYLLFSRGCLDPQPPSASVHGQCHHNGTIFITVPLLTIIVRHWFVRINDRWGFPNDALVLRTFDTFEKHSSWKW